MGNLAGMTEVFLFRFFRGSSFLKPDKIYNMKESFGHQRCPLSLKIPAKWPMLKISALTDQEPDIASSVFLSDFFSFRNLFQLLTRMVTRLGSRAIRETIERQSPNIKPTHESFENPHFVRNMEISEIQGIILLW
jgi:hypothetical protein